MDDASQDPTFDVVLLALSCGALKLRPPPQRSHARHLSNLGQEPRCGPRGDIDVEGTTQAAAIMAVAARVNTDSEGLATAPHRYALIFERTDDGTVLAGPWCMEFLATMRLRRDAWQPLLDLSRIERELLLPALPINHFHQVVDLRHAFCKARRSNKREPV